MKWWLPAVVFVFVLAAQLFLIARIGTDIPYLDEWDVEGSRLYPVWRDGTWHMSDLFRAHNEHRIFWTRLMDVTLFSVNGQWDPLVEMAASALVRAAGAAFLVWMLAGGCEMRGRILVAAGVGLAYLPHVAWQNAIWSFQSHTYFVLLFSMLALAWLGAEERSRWQLFGGLAAGCAALLSQGAGAFTPVALLGLATVRAIERRRWDRTLLQEAWPAALLIAVAFALRAPGLGVVSFYAKTPGQFFNAFGRAASWPHTAMPYAAMALNLPLFLAVGLRLARRRRRAAVGENFVLLIGGWAMLAAAALGWSRGGGYEFDAGVTIRYVDFLLLLPVANAWCIVVLVREVNGAQRSLARLLAGAWGVFLFIGWLGVSAQIIRGFILPRMRDRDLPVRLAVAYQQSRDPAVYAPYSGFYQPHINLRSVTVVLDDPRMKSALPPSFQPGQPMGPLSRAIRRLRNEVSP